MYYKITPLDTLFFRGAEPMEAGRLSVTPLFPPPLSVFYGAIRTTVLKQRNISFTQYNENRAPKEIAELIGECGAETAPFNITSVLLEYNNTLYAPAPFSWFIDSDKKPEKGADYLNHAVKKACNCSQKALERLKINASSSPLPLVPAVNEALSLGGTWIRYEVLYKKGKITLGKNDILLPNELYAIEQRTGISLLDENNRSTRKVKDGALFSAGHIRLKEGVFLIIGTDRECGLAESGMINLGGERRLCGYTRISLSLPRTDSSDFFMALAPVKATEENMDKCFCAGKPVVTAGWDLHKGFHKTSQSWFPAGSVFIENINNQCVPLAQ